MEASNTQKVIKGMSSQTIVTIVLGMVEIVSFSIMSRLLTPQDFGYYAAITAITSVFACFSDAGIGSAIIQRKEIDSRYINNAFTISFLFGLFASVLLIVLARPISGFVADKSMTVPLMLLSVTLLCNCLTSVNTSLMYRQLQFLRVGCITLISLVITTIVAIILAVYGFGYYAIITKAVLSSILTLLISRLMIKVRFRFALDKKTFKSIFNFSGWLMLSGFFRELALQMDRLLMGRLLSVEALGAYNRPKDFLNQISGKIMGIFDTAMFPVLSQIQDDFSSVRNAYKRSMNLINVASIILAFAFIFNDELIIRVFFGVEWFSILRVFDILSLSIIFRFDARLADCYLRSLGLTKQQFWFRVLEMLFKIVGIFIGYKWGILGIAMSVLITDLLAISLKHLYIIKYIGISITEGVTLFYKPLRVGLVLFLILILFYYICSHSIGGDIIKLIIFSVLLSCLIFIPSLLGNEYKTTIYPIICDTIKKTYKTIFGKNF